MKKKITIEGTQPREIIEKFIVPSCLQLSKERFYICGDDLIVEQVPETWEELKELCKSIKGNKRDCGGAMWFEFGCLNNDKMYLGKFLCVDEKGQVGIAERSWGGDISITILAQNRTIPQLWSFIKSLVGEE